MEQESAAKKQLEISTKEIIDFSIQLDETLQEYWNVAAWTPVEGAMLLAGLHPPENCTEVPADGGIGLDGLEYSNSSADPFSEARKIMSEWRYWCDAMAATAEEDGELFELTDEDDPFVIVRGEPFAVPDRLIPFKFVRWFVDFEVKERNAVLRDFKWASAFKELAGYPADNPYVPFAVAQYARTLSRPLEVILAKLNELGSVNVGGGNSAGSTGFQSVNPLPANIPKSLVFATQRGYLTTEEFAAGLGVEPQTILKNHSQHGHYGGVRPGKLPSRRLSWPLDAVDQILKGEMPLNR